MLSSISVSGEQRTRLLEAVLVLVGATAVAGFILVPKLALLAVIGCAALLFVELLADEFRGKFDGILLCWAASFPFSYFVTFPRDHPIITLERAVILLACMGLFFIKPNARTAAPIALRRVALVCLAFIAVAGVTLGKSPDVLSSGRMLLDGFLLPLLLGWCVIAAFDVRRQLPMMHAAVCISSVVCAAIAAAEMVTGQDLLPIGNSDLSSSAGGIPRPNGPFSSNDGLALVGGLSFFFLLFLRRALGPKLSAGSRVLHFIGVTAAIGMALMPMFRSVAITLLLALIIDTFWEQGRARRAWRVVLMLASVGLILIASLLAPDVFEDRSSALNVYGRVAQLEQSLLVFVNHPVLGVGFTNFTNFVVGESRYLVSYEGLSSLDRPHNNLTQILAETGILGFVPYVMTHLLLLGTMWQLRRSSDSGSLVWKYYVYMFLTYWITGLSESSGYDSFLNLWYVFVTTVCFKYGLTEPDLTQPAEVLVPGEAFSVPARVS
jgi:O-antigen ligase/polysaccharide polymerase Wzy-like membrane protein